MSRRASSLGLLLALASCSAPSPPPSSDARVKALIEVGEPVVEPLLSVLESDTRLTRSVHFWRDFSQDRTILGVHEAAYVALASILQTTFFEAVARGRARRGDRSHGGFRERAVFPAARLPLGSAEE